MNVFDNHPWIIVFIILMVTTLIFAFRFSRYSVEKPHLKKGYNQILIGYIIVGLIPTIIMLLADLIGNVNFGKNAPFNYWSLSLHIYGMFISLIGLWWIHLRKGAEFLSEHPGLLRFKMVVVYNNITSTFWIKAIFGFIALAILLNVTLKWVAYFN